MPTIKTKVSLLRELLVLKEVIDAGQIQVAADRNGIKYSNLLKMITGLALEQITKELNETDELVGSVLSWTEEVF